jgi:hypothetical protein
MPVAAVLPIQVLAQSVELVVLEGEVLEPLMLQLLRLLGELILVAVVVVEMELVPRLRLVVLV